MSDMATILAELKNKAADSAQEEQLRRLFQEIADRFESNSSQGVSSLLGDKMNHLRQAFDQPYRAGFGRVVERSVQGVDIDASGHPSFPNFSIEVKTTVDVKVHLARKDIDGL